MYIWCLVATHVGPWRAQTYIQYMHKKAPNSWVIHREGLPFGLNMQIILGSLVCTYTVQSLKFLSETPLIPIFSNI